MKPLRVICLLLAALASTIAAYPALADTGEIGAGIKAGTPGIGPELTIGLTPFLNARAGYNALHFDGSTTESDIMYHYSMKLKSCPILLDLHPIGNSGFRITSGIFINNNVLRATGAPQTTYTIGNTTYPAADIGTLAGTVTFKHYAPFAGIGWGNAVGSKSSLSFAFDLGVIFQGSPDVALAANGVVASDPLFKADLAREISSVKSKISDIKYYPVLSLGLAYKF
ncbi:MAG: hypothetical protein WCH05_04190 [Chlorobiaceae bacterium]